jgi:hypothetical protein
LGWSHRAAAMVRQMSCGGSLVRPAVTPTTIEPPRPPPTPRAAAA